MMGGFGFGFLFTFGKHPEPAQFQGHDVQDYRL
jgi:hypothetical protein